MRPQDRTQMQSDTLSAPSEGGVRLRRIANGKWQMGKPSPQPSPSDGRGRETSILAVRLLVSEEGKIRLNGSLRLFVWSGGFELREEYNGHNFDFECPGELCIRQHAAS